MKSIIKGCIASVVILSIPLVCHAEKIGGELKVYNWVEYLPKDVLADFEKQSGIKVSYDVFDSALTLESRLLTGNSGYDVVFPASAQIPQLIQADALIKLEKSKLPNLGNLDRSFMEAHEALDSGGNYSIPYLWGTTLIGYNKEKVEKIFGPDVSMNDYSMIFDPKNIEKLSSCGVAVLDQPDEIFPLALNYLGLNPNTRDVKDLEKAEQLLLSIRPYIRYFNSSKFPQDLANGDICVAVGWSGAILSAKGTADAAGNGNDIRMALPRQGTLMWSDDMAIPKNAKNLEQAYAFINYILDTNVIARISNQIGYPNPNSKSLSLINPELRAEKDLFIPEEQQANLFRAAPPVLKFQRIQTRMWNRIRTGS